MPTKKSAIDDNLKLSLGRPSHSLSSVSKSSTNQERPMWEVVWKEFPTSLLRPHFHVTPR
jgi:hypothetical protein